MTASESNAPTKHTGITNINSHLIPSNCSCIRGIFLRLSGKAEGVIADETAMCVFLVWSQFIFFSVLVSRVDLFSRVFVAIDSTYNQCERIMHSIAGTTIDHLHNPPYAVNRPRTNFPLSPPFCGYSSFEAQADNALVVCVTRVSLSFSRLCSQPCAQIFAKKIYLRCLRFWFGGNLEKKLGEVFFPPQFTVREPEVSNEDFFVCVIFADGKLPPFLFFFFSSGRSSLDRNGSGMFVPSHFLLIFSLNPFINLLAMPVWKRECYAAV